MWTSLILFAPILLLVLPFKKLLHKTCVSLMGVLLWEMHYILGLKYKIHGKIPSHGIFVSKHMSTMDVAILFKHVPNGIFILKRELMWIPIYGWVFSRLGMLPVNRANGKTNVNKLALDAKKRIDSGYNIIIFPEGTRVKPNTANKYRRGMMFIAEVTKSNIVPIGLNTGLYWQKNQWIKKSGLVDVYFEPSVPYNTQFEQITETIQTHSA